MAVAVVDPAGDLVYFEKLDEEMRLIRRALELTNGNQARAARILGLGTTTLNYKIKAYELL